jgi:outer membrane protein TolC
MGSTLTSGWKDELGNVAQGLAQNPQQMQALQQILEPLGMSPQRLIQDAGTGIDNVAAVLDQKGQSIVDAFRTDTRNIWTGAVMLTQPVFMGGSLIALNKLADISELLMANSADVRTQQTLYDTDQAYWQVVSLNHKKRLAESFLELVKKLDNDVQKMIEEGVATRSDGLAVSVKVNEAEMTVSKVNDGLVLSRMLLCQLCGLPLSEPIVLADENSDSLVMSGEEQMPVVDVSQAAAARPELKMLQNTVDMSRQATNILKAGNLPTVALMGGYLISNPNAFNGWEKKFGGVWNVGVLVRVPVWNWGDVTYKVRASKGATAIASLEMEEAREKIELQVNQSAFKVTESQKRLAMAKASIARANENLRTADLGFREGVITPTTVMEAQTAWLQAQSQVIDAEIDVKLSQVNLQKALGTLSIDR